MRKFFSKIVNFIQYLLLFLLQTYVSYNYFQCVHEVEPQIESISYIELPISIIFIHKHLNGLKFVSDIKINFVL